MERTRKAGVDEEQAFCLDALESGEYDAFTDKAWIRLCEERAAKTRFQDQSPEDTEPV